jgi:DUF309 family protein family protein
VRELEPVWPEAPRHVPDAPLPAYRFVGGLHPHPRTDPRGSLHGTPHPVPGLPASRWREDRSWLLGIDLYHLGYLWEAHEHWEAVFFASQDEVHRTLVQALIQLAAALIQEHKGRAAGVALLVGELERKLRRVVAAVPPGERLAGLDPRRILAQVEAHFAAGARPPRLETN